MAADAAAMSYLTRAQVREIDRRCIEEFLIPGVVLMENASRGVADAAIEELQRITGAATGRVLILAGGGNNGGDGLAAARHLHNRGCGVSIGLAIDPAKYHGDALVQWKIAQAMKLPTFDTTPDAIRSARADLLIDAIFGTGLTTPPRDPFPAIVDAIEASGIPVLAVDLPSGLDCGRGSSSSNATTISPIRVLCATCTSTDTAGGGPPAATTGSTPTRVARRPILCASSCIITCPSV